MDIKKLLMLTTSGTNMKYVDLEEGTNKTVEFQNMSNIYLSTAPEDLTALDKLGNVHTAKKGDIIVKSNCEEVYGVLPGNCTVSELLKDINEQKEAKREKRNKGCNPSTLVREGECAVEGSPCELPMCEETMEACVCDSHDQ